MRKHMFPVLALCGLLSACSESNTPREMPNACIKYFDQEEKFLNDLEASGIVPQKNMECLRSQWVAHKGSIKENVENNRQYLVEQFGEACVTLIKKSSQKIELFENRENMSKEELDATFSVSEKACQQQ